MINPQMKKGLLDTCVLSALLRGDSYGYKIIKDLAPCIRLSESTLYPVLRRLEAGGALTVYALEHNGRLRKMYRITDSGRSQVAAFLTDWKEIEAIYRYIKEGYENDERNISAPATDPAHPASGS